LRSEAGFPTVLVERDPMLTPLIRGIAQSSASSHLLDRCTFILRHNRNLDAWIALLISAGAAGKRSARHF